MPRGALPQGRQAAVVASAGPDLDVGRLLPGAWPERVPASQTTVFENCYHGSRREQVLYSRASFISYLTIPKPKPWRMAPLVLLCPVAQELKPQMGEPSMALGGTRPRVGC